jgi:hypothetical protein
MVRGRFQSLEAALARLEGQVTGSTCPAFRAQSKMPANGHDISEHLIKNMV